jgi:large subunit ribosomal protein L5
MKPTKERYISEAVPALLEGFDLGNPMAVPRLVKVTVNVGLGEAVQNPKLLDAVAEELSAITGQKAVIRRARNSIASFKLREGMPIGVMATLRGGRMYGFLDRLLNIALPRVRDFRGVSPESFDGHGNYTIGLKDQLIFPEIDLINSGRLTGMNVTLVTTAKDDQQGKVLLENLGVPFGTPERRGVLF